MDLDRQRPQAPQAWKQGDRCIDLEINPGILMLPPCRRSYVGGEKEPIA